MTREELKRYWGGRIRETRILSGMSIDELAELSGVDASLISECEQGFYELGAVAFLAVADALDVGIGFLLGASEGETGFEHHARILAGKQRRALEREVRKHEAPVYRADAIPQHVRDQAKLVLV